MNSKAIRKQLLAAIAMVLVAAISLGSSTYAWFAINSKVTATGMSFTTTVQDNLFIATAAHNDTKIKPEVDFKTTEVQTLTGVSVLEPVSTKDGMSFWYSSTANVNGNGAVKNSVWSNYGTTGLTANGASNNFTKNYIPGATGIEAVGFVDYVYDLKAVAGDATTLNLTKLDLNYADKVADIYNTSFRVAVFVEEANHTDNLQNSGSNYTVTAAKDNAATDASATVTTSAGTTGTTAWIFTSKCGEKTGTNFDTTAKNSENGSNVENVSNAVVTGTDSVAPMTYKTDAAKFNVSSGTHYYKVVIRIWLEGQDTNCNNTTFAKLDDGKWSLNTEWTLGDPVSPAEAVTCVTVHEGVKSGTDLFGDTPNTNVTKTINGTTYYQLTNHTNYYVTINSGSVTDGTAIYTIDGDGQITDVTNIVKNGPATYTVTNVLTDITSSGAVTATEGAEYTAILSGINSKTLPATITVEVGGSPLTVSDDYTWDRNSGALSINSGKVTGNITITAVGE